MIECFLLKVRYDNVQCVYGTKEMPRTAPALCWHYNFMFSELCQDFVVCKNIRNYLA